jgi:hypothetical protein
MTAVHPAAGVELFARYAYPPNELGYCGPADGGAALRRVAQTGGDPQWTTGFDGAWPYLDAISAAEGAAGRLDPAVVRAYWVGNDLLDSVDPHHLLRQLKQSFASQTGGLLWEIRAEQVPLAVAHHSLHVFAVYPWAPLLRRVGGGRPLEVLQQCRIRWGTVIDVAEGTALVRSHALRFEAGALSLAPEATETVRWTSASHGLGAAPLPGQLVALHWDWICDRLTEVDCAHLRRHTQSTLDLANALL